MSQNQNTYRSLQELTKSDYQIVDGEPNIIGWKVKSETGTKLGEVDELLFDPETRAVRYLVIDLKNNSIQLDDRKVMVPIGLAYLHTSDDEVIYPNLIINRLKALPDYKKGEIEPQTEVYIRSIFENPEEIRVKDSVHDFNQDRFYSHSHFDKDRFYKRDNS